MSSPLVSVIMASHNAAPFIGEALDSVVGQTYGELELIVVDDCSTDRTAEILAGYAERLPERVRWMRKKKREGPCRARNDALGIARGPYVCWMDHDDLWTPTKVEEQVRVLEERPRVGLAYSYFDAFDSMSKDPIPWPDGRRDLEGNVLGELLLIGCFIGSITAMFRREALDRRGGRLRERDFSIGDDYYLWLTIALDWQVARIPRVLARYRRHPGNESARVASQMDFARWRGGLLQEFLAEFPEATGLLTRHQRIAVAAQLMRTARVELAHGNAGKAGVEAAAASRLDRITVIRTLLGTRAPAAARW
jgi:glycosyltransferase involved in cell wall biosynthesis